MALFGKNDQDLPLLTQFYQLEPPPDGWESDSALLEGSEIETWLRSKEDFSTLREPTETYGSLIRLHPLARSIMDSVHDSKTITGWALSELSSAMRGMADYFLDEDIPAHYYVEEGDQIPIGLLEWQTVREDLYTDLVSDLHAVVMEQKPLARCVECQNVFLPTRSDRIYCSWRCSNRVRVRRNRASKLAVDVK